MSPFHRRALLLLMVWAVAVRLLFALHEPGPGRFFDERYSFENLHALLVADVWRPANGWYGTLAHLPQAAVLALSETLSRWTRWPALAVLEDGRFTATAYRLCRFTVVLYSALTLLLTHRLGRRLAGPGVGLLATFLLAWSPAHLRSSVMFKPDMLMLLGVLAAFLLTLRLLTPIPKATPAHGRRPWRPEVWRAEDGGQFAALGATVGLTTAGKLLGVLAGLPLVLALTLPRPLVPPGGRKRLLAGGVLALVVAGVVFLLVNPFPGLHWDHLQRNSDIYQERAELEGLTRTGALGANLETLVGEGFHGPVVGPAIGILALVGLGGLSILALRSPHGPESTVARHQTAFLIPTFVLGFTVLYTLATAYPKPNNLLPVLPFLSLAAAWLAVRVPARLRRGPEGRTGTQPDALTGGPARLGGLALLALLALTLSLPTHLWAYRVVVPTTTEAAVRLLEVELAPFVGRTLLWRAAPPPPPLVTRRDAVAILRDGGERNLELLDALVLPADDPAATPAGEGRRLTPSPGRRRGPTLDVHLQPWSRVAHHRQWWEEPAGSSADPPTRRWRLEAPPTPSGAPDDPWWSVQILWRDPEPPPAAPALRIETPDAPRDTAPPPGPLIATPLETGGYHYGWAYTSLRFRPPTGATVWVELPTTPARRTPVADVALWSR